MEANVSYVARTDPIRARLFPSVWASLPTQSFRGSKWGNECGKALVAFFTEQAAKKPLRTDFDQDLIEIWPRLVALALILALTTCSLVLFVVTRTKVSRSAGSVGSNTFTTFSPPRVELAPNIQFSDQGPRAYAAALIEVGHDDVVIIPRHGRDEYIVGPRHTKSLLTDAQSTSFAQAVVRMLHLHLLRLGNVELFVSYLERMAKQNLSSSQTEAILARIGPIIADALQLDTERPIEIGDPHRWIQRAIAEAMVVLLFGEHYRSEAMTQHLVAINDALISIGGIYQNTLGWRILPRLWIIKTALVAIFTQIIPRLVFSVLPKLWLRRRQHLLEGLQGDRKSARAPIFSILFAEAMMARKNSMVFIFLKISTLSTVFIFASIHQTAVAATWCVMGLAQRQDKYLQALRNEWEEHIDLTLLSEVSTTTLRRLTQLDSFVREVLRTKGDVFGPLRLATQDIRIGNYVVPRGSLCALYVQRAHEQVEGGGTTFDALRWSRRHIPAVQCSPNFLTFGLGRWACPGRFLAIAEIKLILVAIFSRSEVKIKPGSFHIEDPMNTTSVAPTGVLQLCPRELAE